MARAKDPPIDMVKYRARCDRNHHVKRLRKKRALHYAEATLCNRQIIRVVQMIRQEMIAVERLKLAREAMRKKRKDFWTRQQEKRLELKATLYGNTNQRPGNGHLQSAVPNQNGEENNHHQDNGQEAGQESNGSGGG